MRPWQTIESVKTREGILELRRRGERDFFITVAGRILMTSVAHRSEDELASLSCAALAGKARPKVLLGGLGMGSPCARPSMVCPPARALPSWIEPPAGRLEPRAARLPDPERRRRHAREDRRGRRGGRDRAFPAGQFDAIVLDLYEGPHAATNRAPDPLYGGDALARTRSALRPGGVFAVWSEERDRAFEDRLAAAGFSVERHKSGQGGRVHVVYVGLAGPALAVKGRPTSRNSSR